MLHNRILRIKFFPLLLKSIRLGLLDPEYFMTKVKGNIIFKSIIKHFLGCSTLSSLGNSNSPKCKSNLSSCLFSPGSSLTTECMSECKNLIKEAMKVVCDLQSQEGESRTTQDQLFSNLLRPRLPFEVSNEFLKTAINVFFVHT